MPLVERRERGDDGALPKHLETYLKGFFKARMQSTFLVPSAWSTTTSSTTTHLPSLLREMIAIFVQAALWIISDIWSWARCSRWGACFLFFLGSCSRLERCLCQLRRKRDGYLRSTWKPSQPWFPHLLVPTNSGYEDGFAPWYSSLPEQPRKVWGSPNCTE